MNAKAGAFAYAQSAKAGAFAYAQSAKAGAFAYAQSAKAGAFAYAQSAKAGAFAYALFTQAEGRVLRNVVRINEDAIYRLFLILTRLSSFEVLVGLFRG